MLNAAQARILSESKPNEVLLNVEKKSDLDLILSKIEETARQGEKSFFIRMPLGQDTRDELEKEGYRVVWFSPWMKWHIRWDN
jgi:hypothetical protein